MTENYTPVTSVDFVSMEGQPMRHYLPNAGPLKRYYYDCEGNRVHAGDLVSYLNDRWQVVTIGSDYVVLTGGGCSELLRLTRPENAVLHSTSLCNRLLWPHNGLSEEQRTPGWCIELFGEAAEALQEKDRLIRELENRLSAVRSALNG